MIFCKGYTFSKVEEREKRGGGGRKIIVGAPLYVWRLHASDHREGGNNKTHQMLSQNMVFSHWEALHEPSKRHGRLPDAEACDARANNFFI
jgi:hypothetical protein